MAGASDPSRADVALDALIQVRTLLDEWAGSDWSHAFPAQQIDHILHHTYAKLRMKSMRRERRNATWLAEPISAVWPRSIDMGSEGIATNLCFLVRVTDGAKSAVGRRVEVRMTSQDADFLATSMRSMANWSEGKSSLKVDPARLLPIDSNRKGETT